MSKQRHATTEEQEVRRRLPKENKERTERVQAGLPPGRPRMLTDPRLAHPANAGQRAGLLRASQQALGNQAVQRLLRSGAIQAKLTVNPPGDIYEREADRVADEIMRMPEPKVQRQPEEEEEDEESIQAKPLAKQITPLVQRQVEEEKDEEEEETLKTKPLPGQVIPLIQRQVEFEEEEEGEFVQAKQGPSQTPEVTPELESRIQSLRGGGQSLSASTRAFLEPRFGYDFSNVRIHTDSNAARLTSQLGAEAFTVGRDVYFGAERYRPGTSHGKKLLAHELTHVVQQLGVKKIQNNGNISLSHCTLPLIQMWLASEHVYVGEMVYTPEKIGDIFESVYSIPAKGRFPLKNYPKGLTYGQIAAMADLFKSFQDLYNAPKSEIVDLLGAIEEEEQTIIKKKKSGKSLLEIDEEFRKATAGRYLEMAKTNYAHFSGETPDKSIDPESNIGTWRDLHNKAGEKARIEAGTRMNPEKAAQAIAQNAYADHFLMDAFAVGHLTARSEEMEEERKAIEEMVPGVLAEVLMKELELGPVLSVSAARILLKLKGEEIRKVRFKVVHDLDNEYGRKVSNRDGDEWFAWGDEYLLDPRNKIENLDIMRRAVEGSLSDIESELKGSSITAYGSSENLAPVKTVITKAWTLDDARRRLYELMTENIGLLETLLTDDNEIRDYLQSVSDEEIWGISKEDKKRMTKVLLSGACLDEDEQAILRIIKNTDPSDVVEIIEGQGLEEFLSSFDGEEFEWLVLTLKDKEVFPRLYPGQNLDGIRYLSKGRTTERQEEAIITILESLYDFGKRAEVWDIIRDIGLDQLYSDLTGTRETRFEYLTQKLPVYSRGP